MIFFALACNVTCASRRLALQSLETFLMLKHVFCSPEKLLFSPIKQNYQGIHYVKVGKYQRLPCLVDPVLVTILNLKIFKEV